MAIPLLPLESLEICVLIDNELDPISASPNPAVLQSGGLKTIGLTGPSLSNDPTRPGAARELRMDNICCSAHGLSLLITGVCNGERRTVMFDTGPEEDAWEKNVRRLGMEKEVGKVEVVQLSHWHRDHSGGMLRAVKMIQAAKGEGKERVKVDLHPARPTYRGMKPPDLPVISMEADPTFEEIDAAGGEVVKSGEAHAVAGGFFGVSGFIPRTSEYEKGLKFGMRLDKEGEGSWVEDELMADERFMMCRLKDKGIVVFTGCSHGGVVNASRHSLDLVPDTPLYAVMGGFHLADASSEQISSTAEDLRALDTKVLLAGHCTGWRAKFKINEVFGEGVLCPSFVGSKFVL